MPVTIEVSIPDTLVKALADEPQSLPQCSLEALIIQAYRKGKLTHAQVGELLGFERFQTDSFLKNADAFRPNESEEFASDVERLRQIAK